MLFIGLFFISRGDSLSHHIYEFCSPDQVVIAKKAEIENFLKKNQPIFFNLKAVIQDLLRVLQMNNFRNISYKELAGLCSEIFVCNPYNELKEKIAEHFIQTRTDGQVSQVLEALGPIMVSYVYNNFHLD